MPDSLPQMFLNSAPAASEQSGSSKTRLFVVALLSAIIPGAGHLLERKIVKALIFLITCATLFLWQWKFRLADDFYRILAYILLSSAINVCSVWSIAYAGRKGSAKPTQW